MAAVRGGRSLLCPTPPVQCAQTFSALIWINDEKWRQHLFDMLTAYCDASGGPDHGLMVVAGWISTVAQWDRFDADWRLLLARYDLPYFHMKEFAHSKGPFEAWKGEEGKRRTFLSTACEIIRNYILASIAVGVEYSVFELVDQIYYLTESVALPYCLCARTCIAETNRWAERHAYHQAHIA